MCSGYARSPSDAQLGWKCRWWSAECTAKDVVCSGYARSLSDAQLVHSLGGSVGGDLQSDYA